MEQQVFSNETIFLRNMVCNCCIRVIKQDLSAAGVHVNTIRLGVINISFDPASISLERIESILTSSGFGIVKKREEQLVEQIKIAVLEIVHYSNNVNSIIRKSEYLVEKLGYTYQHLSKIFSKFENITLEKYIILNKIERIKELIDGNEFTLSEIAYMMDYSSVQHLSMQFKNVTGISVSEYKKSDKSTKRDLCNLI